MRFALRTSFRMQERLVLYVWFAGVRHPAAFRMREGIEPVHVCRAQYALVVAVTGSDNRLAISLLFFSSLDAVKSQ